MGDSGGEKRYTWGARSKFQTKEKRAVFAAPSTATFAATPVARGRRGARARQNAQREHTYHRETSVEGTLEGWEGARATADADGTAPNTASG